MKKLNSIPDSHFPEELSIRNVANLVPEHHLRAVVERVLDQKDINKVSKPARQRLDAAIRDSGLRLRGYKNRVSSAPKALLANPVHEFMSESAQVADAVLRIWVDTHKELRRAVTEHAKLSDLQAKGPDHRNRRFRGQMPVKMWNAAISGFQRNNKNAHHPYDVSIMLSMVTGTLPRLVGQGNGPIPPAHPIPPFEAWSEELKRAFASQKGTNAAEQFIRNANEILRDVREDEIRISALANKSLTLSREFMPELVFLGIELPATTFNPQRVLAGRDGSLDDATSVIEKLETALAEYRDASFPDFANWELRHEGIQREMSAARDVADLVGQLNAVLPELDEPDLPTEPEVEPDPPAEDTTYDWETLQAEIQNLTSENADLKRKNFDLEQTVASLKGGKQQPGPPEASPVESVADAVERASKEFEGKGLLFYLNRASDLDTRFERPNEVFEALTWLATTYRTGRIDGGMPDPEHSLKTVCSGWRYASDSPEIAMRQYPDAYSTKAPDGKTYKLAPHIGKGNSNEEKHTIRIAFDWDDESEMAVVGYIGKHQPSEF